ncbi:MAG: alpha/beta hydrolase [Oscillospiraceae bacterium]|nr:alpha/beta hydrolase [Oscillospiraceae bacterium]
MAKRIVLIVCIILLVLAAAMCIATVCIMHDQFGRGEYPDPQLSAAYRYDPDYSSTHARENVQFTSGKNTLQGYLYGMETAEPVGLLVFAHGIGAGHESYINQLMWFADRGWWVFAYDATGSCTSEGSGTVGLVQSALDLDAAFQYVESDPRFEELPVCLLGHSWGGFAVTGVLNFDHRITAVTSLSGYAYPLDMLDAGAVGAVGAPLAAVFRPFSHGYHRLMFGKNSGLNAVDGINRAGVPVLVIHGQDDTTVDYGTLSILSHQGEITAPGAVFETITGDHAHHNDFFNGEAANACFDAYEETIAGLTEEYGGTLPDEVRAQEVAKLDKTVTNDYNRELLGRIEAFYLDAIAAAQE